MYELSVFVSWLGGTAAGVVFAVLQEMGQRYGWPWVNALNQKLLAILLAIVAGVVAAGFEFGLGINLFADVAAPMDILLVIMAALTGSQATWALALRKKK